MSEDMTLEEAKKKPSYGGSFYDDGLLVHCFVGKGSRRLNFIEMPDGLEFYTYERPNSPQDMHYHEGRINEGMISRLFEWLEGSGGHPSES